MTDATKLSRLLSYGLFFYFLMPFAFFLYKFGFDWQFSFNEFLFAFKNSLYQSGAAAFVCLLMGLPMALGLFKMNPVWRSRLINALMVPQILPVFFSVLVGFSVLNPFPLGPVGIVSIFVLINLGFSAVLLHRAIEEKALHFAAVSEVMSVGRPAFYKKIFWPLLKSDIKTIYLMIFIFCFSSFSVPLIAGNGQSPNMEILIYEKIFIDLNWSQAFSLCLVQTLFVFAVSRFAVNKSAAPKAVFKLNTYLTSRFGVFITGVYLLLYFGGYAVGLYKSFFFFDFLAAYAEDLIKATAFSVYALTVYILFCAMLLYLWLWDYVQNKKMNAAADLISVSTLVVGFSVYLFFPSQGSYDVLKLVLAMTLIFFPTLFKIFLQKSLENLLRQIQVAEVFGLSRTRIIFEIILRQLKPQVFLWLSVLSLWFISDYAVSKSVGLQTATLGTVAQSFLSSYRLEAAYLISLISFFVGLLFVICAWFVLQILYAGYKKSTF